MAKNIFSILISLFLMAAGGIVLYCFRLNVPRHIVNITTILGTVFGVALVAAGIAFPLVKKWLTALWQLKSGKVILSLCLVLAIVTAGVFAGTIGSILKAQKNTASDRTTVIILGCQVRGTTPSLMLERRINAAYDYLAEHPDAVAICSGAQGADEDISEAQCMFNLLTEKGIAPERLFLEENSTNTDENIRNSLDIIEKNALSKSVAVATSDFHQKRAAMICARHGLSAAALNADTPGYLVPVYYTREVLGVWKEAVNSDLSG